MNLLDYIKGDRRGPEANRIEREAMTDPLLHEAIEGYEEVEGDHAEALERLQCAVRKRTESRPRYRVVWLSAAAVVLLCIVAGGLYYTSLPEQKQALLAHDEATREAADTATPHAVGQEMLDRQALAEESLKYKAPVIADDEELLMSQGELQESKMQVSIADVRGVDIAEPEQHKVVMEEAPRKEAIRESETAKTEKKQVGPGFITGSERVADTSSGTKTQAGLLTGRITDETGQPLVGVSVVKKGTNKGTLSDGQGYYRLEADKGETLAFNYIGFEPQELTATRTPLNIKMKNDATALDEVVTIGYSTQRTKDITSATPAPPATAAAPAVPATPVEVSQATSPATRSGDIQAARKTFYRYVQAKIAAGEFSVQAQGTVVAAFTVGEDGRPTGIRIVQSASTAAGEEARRLIQGGPNWPPTQETITVVIRF